MKTVSFAFGSSHIVPELRPDSNSQLCKLLPESCLVLYLQLISSAHSDTSCVLQEKGSILRSGRGLSFLTWSPTELFVFHVVLESNKVNI